MKKMALLTIMSLCLGLATMVVGCGKSEEKTAETTPAPQSAPAPAVAPEMQAQPVAPAAPTPEEVAAKMAAEMKAQEEATKPTGLGEPPAPQTGVVVEKIEEVGNQAMQEAADKAREAAAAAVQQNMPAPPAGPEVPPAGQNAAENLPQAPAMK